MNNCKQLLKDELTNIATAFEDLDIMTEIIPDE